MLKPENAFVLVVDVQEKLAYDLYYVRHLSFALDLQVLARTVGVLIRGPGEG